MFNMPKKDKKNENIRWNFLQLSTGLTAHTEELDESIQVLSYNIDYDNCFHMKHNVYEVHEYDDDRQYNEQQ